MKVCLLIGGEGTNASAIIKAAQSGELDITCTGVISHHKQANGLLRAKALGVPSQAIHRKDFSDKPSFEQALATAIESQKPDLVVLAGFMLILSADFIERMQNIILLNIHPSLLPKYPGLNTHQRVLEAGDSQHGATVHIVTPECDKGPIVMQASIPIPEDATADSLKQRLQPVEHQLYIDAIHHICQNPEKFKTELSLKEI